jgi:hypothetical protein
LDVNTVYNIILYCVNKNQNGYVSPSEFNGTLMPLAQNSYVQWLIGEYQSYQTLRPQARVGWGQNQNVRESLTPVIYGYILNPDTNGIAPYPLDYLKTDAMTTIYGFNRIRFATQDRLYSYMNSVIDPVATNPIFLVKDEGYQFYPTTIGQARLSYVRQPPPIFWAFTEDADGLPVWDEANSINPVWADSDILEIIVRALRVVGVNLNANQVSQYANEIKANGQ